jgi:F-type H+-transporting ATPase subunit epsilon
VLVTARRAIEGGDLRRLREAVDEEFLSVDEFERGVRAVMARLETGFLRRFARFQHE